MKFKKKCSVCDTEFEATGVKQIYCSVDCYKKDYPAIGNRVPKYLLATQDLGGRLVSAWLEREQGKHFCHCGCEQEIKIRPEHRYKGIPKYVKGHNRMLKLQKLKNV